ncbi:MAG: hypothetical protein USCGTAYLOR_02631 [Chromatiales bacterium USCg_Taylor]|nr:MAG: hypothetical protein USCGTAYLOR_02631 [Chromatiales bacterium USCg_Taylor]
MVGAGDFPQGVVGVIELILCQYFLCHGQIVSGLGFLDIGDGDDPDLETEVCLVQLPLEGILCRTAEHQLVLGGKHTKIALAHPDLKILAGCIDLGRSLLHAGAGLTQLHPAIIPKHRLGETERVLFVRELPIEKSRPAGDIYGRATDNNGARRGEFLETPCHAGPEAERGQQLGARLRVLLQRGLVGGYNSQQFGIFGLGELVHIDEIIGGRQRAHDERTTSQHKRKPFDSHGLIISF